MLPLLSYFEFIYIGKTNRKSICNMNNLPPCSCLSLPAAAEYKVTKLQFASSMFRGDVWGLEPIVIDIWYRYIYYHIYIISISYLSIYECSQAMSEDRSRTVTECLDFLSTRTLVCLICCCGLVFVACKYTVQYSTVQYSTVQYSSVQYNIVLYSTDQSASSAAASWLPSTPCTTRNHGACS